MAPALPVWPKVSSSSRPRTNFVVPTSAMMSGRARTRAYHSFSLFRAGLRSLWEMLCVYDVMLSTSPEIVTFGCATTGPVIAITAMTVRREMIPIRLILLSAYGVWDGRTGVDARVARRRRKQKSERAKGWSSSTTPSTTLGTAGKLDRRLNQRTHLMQVLSKGCEAGPEQCVMDSLRGVTLVTFRGRGNVCRRCDPLQSHRREVTSPMIFFNDPVPVENPAERAVRMALAMRERLEDLRLKGFSKPVRAYDVQRCR